MKNLKILVSIIMFTLLTIATAFATCPPGEQGCNEANNASIDLVVGGNWVFGDTTKTGGFASTLGNACATLFGSKGVNLDGSIKSTNLGGVDSTAGSSSANAGLVFNIKGTFYDAGTGNATIGGEVKQGAYFNNTDNSTFYFDAAETSGGKLNTANLSTTISPLELDRSISAAGITAGSYDPANNIVKSSASNYVIGANPSNASNSIGGGLQFTDATKTVAGRFDGSANKDCVNGGDIGTNGAGSISFNSTTLPSGGFTLTVNGSVFERTSPASPVTH